MTFKVFIFDLDGVLYKGNSAISGSIDSVKKLREKGMKLFFLTNAGTRSRKGRVCKLNELGYNVNENEVYTSSFGVAHYISTQKENPTAYVIGEKGLEEELSSHNIKFTEKNPDFVVASLDRNITYKKLTTAFKNILEGSKFVVTNDDPSFPAEEGLLPGAGSIVHSIQFSTGIKPLILGKPNTYLIDMILKHCDCSKEEILFVGDRLSTDIKIAKKVKIKSALVLTGVNTKEDVEKLEEKEKPDYIANSLKDLMSKIL